MNTNYMSMTHFCSRIILGVMFHINLFHVECRTTLLQQFPSEQSHQLRWAAFVEEVSRGAFMKEFMTSFFIIVERWMTFHKDDHQSSVVVTAFVHYADGRSLRWHLFDTPLITPPDRLECDWNESSLGQIIFCSHERKHGQTSTGVTFNFETICISINVVRRMLSHGDISSNDCVQFGIKFIITLFMQ